MEAWGDRPKSHQTGRRAERKRDSAQPQKKAVYQLCKGCALDPSLKTLLRSPCVMSCELWVFSRTGFTHNSRLRTQNCLFEMEASMKKTCIALAVLAIAVIAGIGSGIAQTSADKIVK